MKMLLQKAVVLLLLLPTIVLADNDLTGKDLTQRLENYFSTMESLRGNFRQQVSDSSGRPIEESFGTLLIQRPGKFRWQTKTPFVQKIIGDGERIWIYDPDLEQVTVRRQGDSFANTPAALLTQGGSLQSKFTIQPIDNRAGKYQWVELISKERGDGFEHLLIAMDGNQLKAIEVEDSLGQRTYIEFRRLRLNAKLSNQSFQFTPPPGVDLVGDL